MEILLPIPVQQFHAQPVFMLKWQALASLTSCSCPPEIMLAKNISIPIYDFRILSFPPPPPPPHRIPALNPFPKKTNNPNPSLSETSSDYFCLLIQWRESNSRPLEDPHSSALPKLRYTRISTAASLPKRGDMRYYTQIQQFCQQILQFFFAFFRKSRFGKYALYSFCSFACRA